MELIDEDPSTTQTKLDEYFTTLHSKHLFSWKDFIINGLLPFHFVEKAVIRKHVKAEAPSIKTFMKYLHLLTECVEKKVAAKLPNQFALVFDGWTDTSTHYLAVFASYPTSNSKGYSKRLLTVSPVGEEINLSASEHYDFITYILHLYGKSWSDIVCLIGDNVSTNKALANKTGIPMVGCASHRFNLAMRDILHKDQDIIAKVNSTMVKLRGLLLSAKLQKLTHLKPQVANVTRWSSIHNMLNRYTELREYLPMLESDEIDMLLLTASENRKLESLLNIINPLESVTKTLQEESTSIGDARALFDAVMEKFPESTRRLSSSASIVHSTFFESAIVKIQRDNAATLSREESCTVSKLWVQDSRKVSDVDEGLSFAQRALKRQKVVETGVDGHYMDTRFIQPTSNICERLFSKVGFTLSDRRKRLHPANLEAQIFLHLNQDLWDCSDINRLTND